MLGLIALRVLFLAAASEGYFHCRAWFSLQWVLLVAEHSSGALASVAAVHRLFSSRGLWAELQAQWLRMGLVTLRHVESSPRPGIEPVSPELAEILIHCATSKAQEIHISLKQSIWKEHINPSTPPMLLYSEVSQPNREILFPQSGRKALTLNLIPQLFTNDEWHIGLGM